jgi:type II secretory pathway component GspD/PulD (secretin)
VKAPPRLSPEMLDRLREMQRAGKFRPKSNTPDDRPSDNGPAPSKGTKSALPPEHSTQLSYGARIVYVADQQVAKTPADSNAPAPIVVMPGPQGLIIASEDAEALDEFERLLDMLGNNGPSNRRVSVFYLKYAKASAVTETLGQILGGTPAASGGAASSGGGGGGNPMADMFAGPFGGFGGPFGGGGGGGGRRGRNNADGSESENTATATVNPSAGRTGLATGAVKITADQRLNALLVRANRADLDTIELLKVLDQKESPEDISVATKPRMIAVRNTPAQDIADIIKQVYADRLVENPNANRGGGFAAMMMAARGANQNRTSKDDVAKMSLGIDTRTNSLIVAAPDALFEEVKQLVAQLDTAAGDQNQTVRVVTLHRTSSTAVEQALAAIAGSSVQVSRTTAANSGGQTGSPYQQPQQQNNPRRGQYGGGGPQPSYQPGMGGGNNGPMQQGNMGGRGGGSYGQPQRYRQPQN